MYVVLLSQMLKQSLPLQLFEPAAVVVVVEAKFVSLTISESDVALIFNALDVVAVALSYLSKCAMTMKMLTVT